MFGISGEHLLVLLVILLIFGPKRLPDLGNSLGRTLKNFKDAMNNNNDAASALRPAQPVAKPQQIVVEAEAVAPVANAQNAQTQAQTQEQPRA